MCRSLPSDKVAARLVRSMCPKQIGGNPLLAAVTPTDVRKEFGVSADVHSRWLKTR